MRSPVVMTASAPAFLAPGDQSRISLEIDNVDGPSGSYALEVSVADGLRLEGGSTDQSRTLDLENGKKALVLLSVSAEDMLTKSEVVASLTGPQGEVFVKRFSLEVEDTQPEVVRQSSFSLASGDSLSLDADTFDGGVPDSGSLPAAPGTVEVRWYRSSGVLAVVYDLRLPDAAIGATEPPERQRDVSGIGSVSPAVRQAPVAVSEPVGPQHLDHARRRRAGWVAVDLANLELLEPTVFAGCDQRVDP